jgi:hypothetical protein
MNERAIILCTSRYRVLYIEREAKMIFFFGSYAIVPVCELYKDERARMREQNKKKRRKSIKKNKIVYNSVIIIDRISTSSFLASSNKRDRGE